MIALVALVAVFVPSIAVDPCCSPDQWEASIAGLGGVNYADQPVGFVDSDSVHFDYTNKKLAISYRRMGTNGYRSNRTAILDIVKEMAYYIEGPTCAEFVWQEGLRQDCVGADEKFLTQFYFGVGNRQLTVNSWTSSPEDDVYIVSSRARDTCVPVMMNELRSGSTPEVRSAFIFNITPGIRDNSVFTPPANCKQASGVPGFLEEEPIFQLAKRMFIK